MARPCDEGKKCSYSQFDDLENCWICAIDFSGDDCPYVKPWGKRKYEKEQVQKGE